MTRAERLHNLLKRVKENESKSLLQIWYDLFNISTIFEVYDRLIYVKKEIDAFGLEIEQLKLHTNPQFRDIINTLNFIVEFQSLSSSINNYQLIKKEKIDIVFASFSIYQAISEQQHILIDVEEDIPNDEFKSFKDNIKNIIEEIKNSDISNNDKNIFLSIFNDMEKAISLYQINGLDAFMEVIRNNLCKIQIISSDESKYSEKFKRLAKIAIGKLYLWSKTYIKKKVINSIEMKTVEYFDEQISKWAVLPEPKSNLDDIEDTDVIESED